ncbi:MAG: DUF6318 family protein [Actinomycetota bacterium]|nr:DUF6318 family protein [Actinomycetota bacterium]
MGDQLRTATVSLLVETALLSGCSERQEASTTLPAESAAPTTSAEALPPLGPPDLPMPAEARAKTPEGAQIFVRYYIGLINRTSTVLDAAPLREFSNRCEDCNRIATGTENAAAAGEDFEGGDMIVTFLGQPLMTETTAEMVVRIDQKRFIVLDATGQPTEASSEPFFDLYGGASLEWDGQRRTWIATQLTFNQ